MPEERVRDLFSYFRPVSPIRTDVIVEEMAERFVVTKMMMGYRLERMRLIALWEEWEWRN